MTQDFSTRQHQYLRPSRFWSMRQGFPRSWAIALAIGSLSGPLLLWTLMSHAGWVSPLFLPSPTKVLAAGYRLWTEDNFGFDILMSCGRVLLSFLLAAVIGVPIGLAMGSFNSLENLFAPFVGLIRYMPVTAFIPLIICWFGPDEVSKIMIVTFSIVFYNALMVADAVKLVPNDLIDVAYTLGGTRWDVVRRVILPAAFPSVLTTLRVNMATAWSFLVIAEVISAQNGFGMRIQQSVRVLKIDKAMFVVLVIGLIGVALDLSFKSLSSRLTPWANQTRQ